MGVVSVFVYSDVGSAAGGLSLQMGTDGVNWDRTKDITIRGGVSNVHTLTIVARYFRVVYTNGSSAQSEFRMQTIFHTSKPRDLSTSTLQVMEDSEDVQLIRQINEPDLDRAAGLVFYEDVVHKFGDNDDVGSTAEDVWSVGGVYPGWLLAASAVRIKAGGSGDDAAAGTGCQKVLVSGLDENWDEASEELTTAGASASSPSTTTFIRVNRVYCTDVGAYTGNNAADINIETTGGVQVAAIEIGFGQSQMSMYTCPNQRTCYMTEVSIQVETTNTAEVDIWRRENADDATTPFTSKRLVHRANDLNGIEVEPLRSYVMFPAKTDIWASAAKKTGGGNSEVAVNYDLIVVHDEGT